MVNKNGEIERKVTKWLENQGYPFEMTVADIFQKAGFTVSLSDWYKDFETNDHREIDVTALKWSDFEKSKVLQVCWRVECKLARDKPWVIFVSTAQPETFLPLNLIASTRYKSILLESLKKEDLRKKLYKIPLFSPKYVGHGITQAFTSGQDVPYKAVMSSVKSSIARIIQLNELNIEPTINNQVFFCVTFPVIIIDGKLFEYFIDNQGESHIQEVESSFLYWKGNIPDHSSPLVYVITKSGLTQFVESARKATEFLIKLVGYHNQNIT